MRRGLLLLLVAAAVWPLAAEQSGNPSTDAAKAIASLRWRSIGPNNFAGRIVDIVGVPGDPAVFYIAPGDGGIFKTTNGGTTMRPLFQGQGVYSVGALAIAPSDPNVIWAGTGEGNPRNTASFGDGVYRSTDAGESWAHLGLTDTERIARIRVDPRKPDVAFVAALGHEWGPNEERGVFKTVDGGKTWTKALYIDPDTGCSDLDLDPSNPRIVYAAMYTFRRKPWRFDSGAGATALYRSVDGGATWKKLTNGLPKGSMERPGVAIAYSRPETVYMIAETKDEGVLFRSDDRGDSWRKVTDDGNIIYRAYYFSDIRVDPNDPERLYSLAGQLWLSRDGGRSWETIGRGTHGDHQGLWIDPLNSKRVLSASDGGFHISWDGASTFDVVNNIATAQAYHVSADMQRPYTVCGGFQDNGVWCGPSATLYTEGIRRDDWYTIAGGDGMFAVADPTGPNFVYSTSHGGNIHLTDRTTGSQRSIHPYPVIVGSSGSGIAEFMYRFNWNSPVEISPHDPKTVYFGGNVIFKTGNRGQTWTPISPDLTTNDKSKQQSSGGTVSRDNTSAEFHCTILTIAESPVRPGVIWAGTDDGNVQVTRDGGKTWTNVTGRIAGLPANSWIPTIDASHADAGTAYVAADRHQNDDFGPYAFKTTDFGQTWTPIKGDLPAKGYVHVVREDPKTKNLLYAGTEVGIFASWDGGAHWTSIRNNLPPVAVRDLVVHPRDNDLILATHGRGIWILDDITAVQQAAAAAGGGDLLVYQPRPAVRYQMWQKDGDLGQRTFTASNPPYGALIYYRLASESKDGVSITITEKSGRVVREIRDAPAAAGANRAVWDLRYTGAARTTSERLGEGGPMKGPLVVPGEYTVKVQAGASTQTRALQVDSDPRITISLADLQAERDALLSLRDMTARINTVIDRAADLAQQLAPMAERFKRSSTASATSDSGSGGATPLTGGAAAVAQLQQHLDSLLAPLTRAFPRIRSMHRWPPGLREEVAALAAAIDLATAPLTEPQQARLKELAEATGQVVSEMNGIVDRDVPELNRALSGLPRLVPGPAIR